MKVKTAGTAGFCFGVKRAVDKVYEEIRNGGKIYTYGDIINNKEVVNDIRKKGVTVLYGPEELEKVEEGAVIIRSHGVSKEIYDMIRGKRKVNLIDATCPYVLKIHRIVEDESRKGRNIVIIGDPRHPEVEGIMGFSGGAARTVETAGEARGYSPGNTGAVTVVSQTTFNLEKFNKLVEILEKKGYSINTVNTICGATEARQREAREIASEADVMIVVGDQRSSNTMKLYEICSEVCADTRHVETVLDLDSRSPLKGELCGITAGASTPDYIIEEVQSHVRGADI